MIKAGIAREYPAHIAKCRYSSQTLYLADYSKQTRSARRNEVFEGVAPSDIMSFELTNNVGLKNGYISFDNTSFIRPDGNPLPQCECVVFPETSTSDSWMFFAELKYGSGTYWNDSDIKKAISQLYKTRAYYKNKNVFSNTNTCYLMVSLPEQSEPFVQSILTPPDLLRLKIQHNVILRLTNHAEIQDDKMINV